MNRNRKDLSMGLFAIILGCLLLTCTNGQNTISKIWTGVDNNLRANAPDENLRKILVDARLRAVVPTSGGMILLYTLADST